MICWGLYSCIYSRNQPPSFCGDTLERLEVFIVPEKIYRTGIYARLSREDNEHGESNSISSQKAICMEYISRHPDLELVEIYDEDDGYSGTNMERPGFQRMLQDMRSGKIDCAISKDLSRFSRNYIEAGNYLEKIFPSLGIRYIAVNDCYDSLAPGSASDAITLPFKNLVNDIYCRDISVKIRTNLEVKRRKGEYVGSFAPYGYQKSAEDKNRSGRGRRCRRDRDDDFWNVQGWVSYSAHCAAAEPKRRAHADGAQAAAGRESSRQHFGGGMFPNGNTTPSPEY